MQASSSVVPELLRTGDFLRASMRDLGMEMRPFAHWEGLKPRSAVFWDCPKMEDKDLQFCLREQVPFLLVISENLHLQPNSTYPQLKSLAARVLTYQEDEVDNRHVFWLPYGLDLAAGRRFRQSVLTRGRPFLLGMINSWKKSEMPGDLYAWRNLLAIEAGKILREKMFLAGAGWDRHLVYPHKWQRSLAKRAPEISRRLFGWPNPACRGPLPPGEAKLEALARCEFALVPENCSSLSGYVTEKIFNALFAGCIPVYQGHSQSFRWLPADMFVPMNRFTSGNEFVCYLQAMSHKEKNSLREAGQGFLESEQVAPFDQCYYAQVIIHSIHAILGIREPDQSKTRQIALLH